jgi:SAM-dependent MidA family methyltransferase
MAHPHSSAVERDVRAALAARGRLTFTEFLDIVQYGPHGYYAGDRDVVGPGGDFLTSPELHPAFGALVGVQAHAVWTALGQPTRVDLVEFGAGSGALARDLLTWSQAAHPQCFGAIRYCIAERSTHLVERQRATLAAVPDAAIHWLAEASVVGEQAPPIQGLVIAHELLDALPFHLLAEQDRALVELYVADAGGQLALLPGAPSTPELGRYLERVGGRIAPSGRAEVSLEAERWLRRVVPQVRRGAILVVDYGADAETLYARARPRGTLRCYYQHTAGDDPLARLGRQDITADVDFTTLALVARELGLGVAGPAPQVEALRLLGLEELSLRVASAPMRWSDREANVRALRELVESDGLGRVQWLLLARGLPNFRAFSPVGSPSWGRLPLLLPGQLRLPGPETLEGLADAESQWKEFWSNAKDDAD